MKLLESTSIRGRLLSGTVIPVALGVGLAMTAAPSAADNPLPTAAKKVETSSPAKRRTSSQPATSALPKAVARPVQLAACGACGAKKACGACGAKKACGACGAKKGCGACGAKKGCGACGAKKGCGACGAKKGCGACGACGACGGAGAVSAACIIPRLAKANPCAAKKACGACGACGAKKACGACGAKKGCGACGAKKACGACGAKKACGACGAKKACGACGAKKACGACGAKKGCGACGAKKACGACGAKKGCGACGAKKGCGACGACGACGGKPAIKVSNAEAAAAYNCLLTELKAAYAKSGNRVARSYAKWKRYNKVAYVSETHGSRLVNNYGNRAGRRYINYDKVKRMPVGSILAKDSFQVQAGGKLALGPLFLMEKMVRGWYKASGDWKYSMVMPDGTVLGTTRGKGADKVKFCYECHISAAEKDSIMLLPEEHRVKR